MDENAFRIIQEFSNRIGWGSIGSLDSIDRDEILTILNCGLRVYDKKPYILDDCYKYGRVVTTGHNYIRFVTSYDIRGNDPEYLDLLSIYEVASIQRDSLTVYEKVL